MYLQVVVLIDNYDTPLNKAESDADRGELLRVYVDYFTILKSKLTDIRLAYVTGAKSYGGIDGFADISTDAEYTTLCDTTEAELRALAAHYNPGINYTSAQLLNLKKKYYNINISGLTDSFSLIKVPANRPFIKQLESCVNMHIDSLDCQHPVGLDPFIDKAAAITLRELPRNDTSTGLYRKRPIVLSRLARGGKTTGLRKLFDRLQGAQLGDDHIRVMIISFNGSSDFAIRDGETQEQALLRVIAQQLVEGTDKELTRLLVDEDELDNYIGKKPFLLLIDEINQLSTSQPLDPDTSRLLRKLFLRKNRYIVMTTHVPLDLDVMFALSDRGYYSVQLPTSTDLRELREMSIECSALTPLEVARYGSLPSLIYAAKVHSDHLEMRYAKACIKRMVEKLNKKQKSDLYSRVIDEFVTGNIPAIRPLDKLDAVEQIRISIYQFASSTPSGKLVWPLCYMDLILEDMIVNDQAAWEAHQDLLKVLKQLTYVSTTEGSGKDWELIIQIGILLQCINAYLSPRRKSYPLSLVPPGVKAEVRLLGIPADKKKLDSAWSWTSEMLKLYSRPTVILAVPALSSFPTYDMFLIYTPGTAGATAALKSGSEPSAGGQALNVEEVRVAGIQAKSGKKGSNQRLPAFVNSGSYLVRGRPVKKDDITKRGWFSMGMKQVQQLLGFSLAPLMPIAWTSLSDEDTST